MKKKVWIEKYRPTEWTEFVSDDKEKLQNIWTEPFSAPHLLLVSKVPGTGKTSLAKLIIKQLGADSLVLNSSSDRKIETIRSKIMGFASTLGMKQDVPKIVLLDELDGTPKLTQEALRNVMETFSGNCKFIITANDINKVHDAVVSRCVQIDFKQPSKEAIYKHLTIICTAENLEFDDAGLKKVVDINYPSIRNMINQLQEISLSGKTVKEEHVKKLTDVYDALWAQIKLSNFEFVRKQIIENNVDVQYLNKHIWNSLLNQGLSKKIANVTQILAENEYRFSVGADYNIIFISSLIDIITEWRKE